MTINNKKSILFNTGHVEIQVPSTGPPDNTPDGYPAIVDVYAINNMKPIEEMTLMNHGPGDLFFITRNNLNFFSTTEEHLLLGEIRKLTNVYEVRLRTNVPLTSYHLLEGVQTAGPTPNPLKSFVENRISIQANEKQKRFSLSMDTAIPPIFPNPFGMLPIVPPVPVTYLSPSYIAPIAAGVTQQAIDIETAIPMPFIVPQGFILEAFAVLWNFNVNSTVKAYFELLPGSGIYNFVFALPISARGAPNLILNVNPISTQVIDPFGAPVGGRGVLFTVTNDDVAVAMIGELDVLSILRELQ